MQSKRASKVRRNEFSNSVTENNSWIAPNASTRSTRCCMTAALCRSGIFWRNWAFPLRHSSAIWNICANGSMRRLSGIGTWAGIALSSLTRMRQLTHCQACGSTPAKCMRFSPCSICCPISTQGCWLRRSSRCRHG